MCFNQNNKETIESLLERLRIEQINNADIWHRIGILYQNNMQHQEAINAFSIAMQLICNSITYESITMSFANLRAMKGLAENASLRITELEEKLSNIRNSLRISEEAIINNTNRN